MPPSSSPVAIVTGGARGIGRRCAHALARAGYAIALVDLLVPEMQRTAAEIAGIRQEAMVLEADVADHARAKAVVPAMRAQGGGRIVSISSLNAHPAMSPQRSASSPMPPPRRAFWG